MWANSKLVLNFSNDKFSLFVHQTESHYAANKLKLCCSMKIKNESFHGSLSFAENKFEIRFDSYLLPINNDD